MSLPAFTWISVLLILSSLSSTYGQDVLRSDEYYEDYVDEVPLNTTYKLNVPDSFKKYLEKLLNKGNSTDSDEDEEEVNGSLEQFESKEIINDTRNQNHENKTHTSENELDVEKTLKSLGNTLNTSKHVHGERPKIYHPYRTSNISQLLNGLEKGQYVSHSRNYDSKHTNSVKNNSTNDFKHGGSPKIPQELLRKQEVYMSNISTPSINTTLSEVQKVNNQSDTHRIKNTFEPKNTKEVIITPYFSENPSTIKIMNNTVETPFNNSSIQSNQPNNTMVVKNAANGTNIMDFDRSGTQPALIKPVKSQVGVTNTDLEKITSSKKSIMNAQLANFSKPLLSANEERTAPEMFESSKQFKNITSGKNVDSKLSNTIGANNKYDISTKSSKVSNNRSVFLDKINNHKPSMNSDSKTIIKITKPRFIPKSENQSSRNPDTFSNESYNFGGEDLNSYNDFKQPSSPSVKLTNENHNVTIEGMTFQSGTNDGKFTNDQPRNNTKDNHDYTESYDPQKRALSTTNKKYSTKNNMITKESSPSINKTHEPNKTVTNSTSQLDLDHGFKDKIAENNTTNTFDVNHSNDKNRENRLITKAHERITARGSVIHPVKIALQRSVNFNQSQAEPTERITSESKHFNDVLSPTNSTIRLDSKNTSSSKYILPRIINATAIKQVNRSTFEEGDSFPKNITTKLRLPELDDVVVKTPPNNRTQRKEERKNDEDDIKTKINYSHSLENIYGNDVTQNTNKNPLNKRLQNALRKETAKYIQNSTDDGLTPKLSSTDNDSFIESKNDSTKQLLTNFYNKSRITIPKLENVTNNKGQIVNEPNSKFSNRSNDKTKIKAMNYGDLNSAIGDEKSKQPIEPSVSMIELQNSKLNLTDGPVLYENKSQTNNYFRVTSHKEQTKYDPSPVASALPTLEKRKNILLTPISGVTGKNNDSLSGTLENSNRWPTGSSNKSKNFNGSLERSDIKQFDKAIMNYSSNIKETNSNNENPENNRLQNKTTQTPEEESNVNYSIFNHNSEVVNNNGNNNFYNKNGKQDFNKTITLDYLSVTDLNKTRYNLSTTKTGNDLDLNSLGSVHITKNETERHPIEDLLNSLIKIDSSQKVLKRRKKKRKVKKTLPKRQEFVLENKPIEESNKSNIAEINISSITNPNTTLETQIDSSLLKQTHINSSEVDEKLKSESEYDLHKYNSNSVHNESDNAFNAVDYKTQYENLKNELKIPLHPSKKTVTKLNNDENNSSYSGNNKNTTTIISNSHSPKKFAVPNKGENSVQFPGVKTHNKLQESNDSLNAIDFKDQSNDTKMPCATVSSNNEETDGQSYTFNSNKTEREKSKTINFPITNYENKTKELYKPTQTVTEEKDYNNSSYSGNTKNILYPRESKTTAVSNIEQNSVQFYGAKTPHTKQETNYTISARDHEDQSNDIEKPVLSHIAENNNQSYIVKSNKTTGERNKTTKFPMPQYENRIKESKVPLHPLNQTLTKVFNYKNNSSYPGNTENLMTLISNSPESTTSNVSNIGQYNVQLHVIKSPNKIQEAIDSFNVVDLKDKYSNSDMPVTTDSSHNAEKNHKSYNIKSNKTTGEKNKTINFPIPQHEKKLIKELKVHQLNQTLTKLNNNKNNSSYPENTDIITTVTSNYPVSKTSNVSDKGKNIVQFHGLKYSNTIQKSTDSFKSVDLKDESNGIKMSVTTDSPYITEENDQSYAVKSNITTYSGNTKNTTAVISNYPVSNATYISNVEQNNVKFHGVKSPNTVQKSNVKNSHSINETKPIPSNTGFNDNTTLNHQLPETKITNFMNSTNIESPPLKQKKINGSDMLTKDNSSMTLNMNGIKLARPNQLDNGKHVQTKVNKESSNEGIPNDNTNPNSLKADSTVTETKNISSLTFNTTLLSINIMKEDINTSTNPLNTTNKFENKIIHTPSPKELLNKTINQINFVQQNMNAPEEVKSWIVTNAQTVNVTTLLANESAQSPLPNITHNSQTMEQVQTNKTLLSMPHANYNIVKQYLGQDNTSKAENSNTNKPGEIDSFSYSKDEPLSRFKELKSVEHTTKQRYGNHTTLSQYDFITKKQPKNSTVHQPANKEFDGALSSKGFKKVDETTKAATESRSDINRPFNTNGSQHKTMKNFLNTSAQYPIKSKTERKQITNPAPINEILNKTRAIIHNLPEKVDKTLSTNPLTIRRKNTTTDLTNKNQSSSTINQSGKRNVETSENNKDKRKVIKLENVMQVKAKYIKKLINTLSRLLNSSDPPNNFTNENKNSSVNFVKKIKDSKRSVISIKELMNAKNKTAQINSKNYSPYSQKTLNNVKVNMLEISKLDNEHQNVSISNVDVKDSSVLTNRPRLQSFNMERGSNAPVSTVSQEFSSGNLSNGTKGKSTTQYSRENKDNSKNPDRANQVEYNSKVKYLDDAVHLKLNPEMKETDKSRSKVSIKRTKPLLNVYEGNSYKTTNMSVNNSNTSLQTQQPSNNDGKSNGTHKHNENITFITQNYMTAKTQGSFPKGKRDDYSNHYSIDQNIAQALDENGRIHIIITPLDKKPNISVEMRVEDNNSSSTTKPFIFQTNKSLNLKNSEFVDGNKNVTKNPYNSTNLFGSHNKVTLRGLPNSVRLRRLPNNENHSNNVQPTIKPVLNDNSIQEMNKSQVETENKKPIASTTMRSVKYKQEVSAEKSKDDHGVSKDFFLDVSNSNKVTNRKRITKKEEVVEVNEKMNENKILGKSKTVQKIKTEISSVDYV